MTADTIFAKIIRREIPADIIFETDEVLAFRDISPQAPTHLLIIPKKALPDLGGAAQDDAPLLGRLLLAAAGIAKDLKLDDGYRLVINNGRDAGQAVAHLHVHLLAGRPLAWPPG